MTTLDWNIVTAIAELVGAVAVVVTLIYLSIQIRQNTATVHAATELESSRLFLEFHSRMSHSADMASIWDLGLTDADRLSPDQKRRFVWLVSEYFFMVEGLFVQHKQGFLSDGSWLPHEKAVTGMLGHTVIRNWWDSGVSPFTDGFSTHVQAVFDKKEHTPWQYQPLADL
jgi:hypothetical protein